MRVCVADSFLLERKTQAVGTVTSMKSIPAKGQEAPIQIAREADRKLKLKTFLGALLDRCRKKSLAY